MGKVIYVREVLFSTCFGREFIKTKDQEENYVAKKAKINKSCVASSRSYLAGNRKS